MRFADNTEDALKDTDPSLFLNNQGLENEIERKNEFPLVAVIIPTYKRAERLSRALDSVIDQTYTNLEIIVVNDNVPGSEFDKATESLLDEYKAKDTRLRCLHTSGKTGGGAARNFACQESRGEYLAFLDDDDLYLPDKVETQLSFMISHDLEMSWQDVSWYDDSGNLVEHRRLDHCYDFSKNGLLRAHLLTPISPTAIYMLKKTLFMRTEGFGEVASGQDWWLMLRCIEADAKIGYMPGVHVHQILHKGERLSLGANKIAGEEARHRVVESYYPMLSRKDIRFIEFRHNAVLAFSSLRSKCLTSAVKYAFKAALASPTSCVREGLKYFTSGKDR